MKIERTFGDTIKMLRNERRLPLRKVADAIGIDTSMLGKIEKNQRKPTKQLIEKFAEYFNIGERELLIAFLSDTVAYKLMDEEDISGEVFKVRSEENTSELQYRENLVCRLLLE